jgi:hypothetical protein
MKHHIISSLLLTALGVFVLSSCSDDEDYTVNTTPIITAVTTGNAEVTATSAVTDGQVLDLSSQASSAYQLGTIYSTTQSDVAGGAGTKVVGVVGDNGTFTATLSGLSTNKTYYYATYVTLQGKITKYGDVKSFTTTSAVVTTKAATDITGATATFGATVTGISGVSASEMTAGVKLGATADADALKAGLDVPGTLTNGDLTQVAEGLLPNHTYYYMPYLKVGSGYVYGEMKSFTTTDFTPTFVDLGLSVQWCKTNVGALSEEQLGGKFQYSDLTGLSVSESAADFQQSDIFGNTQYDVAAANKLGRMPTTDEVRELINSTTHEVTTVNGVQGMKFTAKNGNSIFLPFAGMRTGNTVTDDSKAGYYWTGKINSGDNKQYASAMEVNSTDAGLDVHEIQQALAIRSVQKTQQTLNKTLLNTTWYIDLDKDGNSWMFDGPLYYYGTADSWNTVTNGDIVSGDSWNWSPVYNDNTWLTTAQEWGQMTFHEDGSFSVTQVTDAGATQTAEGTYTVDEANKTLTLQGTGARILHLYNFDGVATNWSTDIKILSLTADKMQLGVVRDNSSEGPCLLVHNYISQNIKTLHEKVVYTPTLTLYDGDGNHWNGFTSQTNLEAGKTYTLEASGQRSNAQVYIFEIPGLAKDHPNAIIRIDKIEVDGTEVAFDANKFKYGDLEGSGNYRVELFNIWGAGTAADSPFGGGAKDSEPALAFNSSIKITYTVVTLDGFTAGLTLCGSDWNSSWPDASVAMPVKGGFPQEYTVTFNGSRVDGMIDLLEVKGFAATFPNAKLTLKRVLVDGTELPFDASKVLYGDLEGNGNYRIELYNTYGATKGNAPFAGETDNGTIPALGCQNSIAVTFTLDYLY